MTENTLGHINGAVISGRLDAQGRNLLELDRTPPRPFIDGDMIVIQSAEGEITLHVESAQSTDAEGTPEVETSVDLSSGYVECTLVFHDPRVASIDLTDTATQALKDSGAHSLTGER